VKLVPFPVDSCGEVVVLGNETHGGCFVDSAEGEEVLKPFNTEITECTEKDREMHRTSPFGSVEGLDDKF
jgi:hypothetical protein